MTAMPHTIRLSLVAFVLACSACAPVDGEGTGTATEGVVVCGRGPTVDGIDVSEWQGAIDWGAVASGGYRFAIARISDGFYLDRYFGANWDGIRAAGLVRGAYQYFEPGRDPIAQADIVVRAVGRLGPGDLPVTLDVEATNPGVSPGEYASLIHRWVDRVTEGTGRAPMIYTGRYYWDGYVASGDFASLPLWHAQYTSASCPNISNFWSDWGVWQYSSTGRVPGIAGNVDMNRFNGTLEELRALAQSNRAPVGYLDEAGCDTIRGWAQDPDAPDGVIDVHVYIGGPAGSGAPGFPLHAGARRDDLCTAIGSCNHGFSMPTPLALQDGAPHEVFAYGIDATGGNNPLLGNSPRVLQCATPNPPLPPERAVRRHVPNPTVLAAWHWSGMDIAVLPDAVVDGFRDGPDVVDAPVLVSQAGDPAVYILENATLRHVPDPAAMDAWRFDWGAIQQNASGALEANIHGAALAGRPFLMRPAGGPAVYLVDAPPPLWAEPVSDDVPRTMRAGSVQAVTFTMRNRGSFTWTPDTVVLGADNPRHHDSPVCDPGRWLSCQRAATVSSVTAPGATGTFTVSLRAPDAPGTSVTACFGLAVGEHWFGDPGQMGPGDDALCRTIAIDAVAAADAGVRGDAGAIAHGDAGRDGSTHPTGVQGNCACRAVGAAPAGGSSSHSSEIVLALAALAACVTARRRRPSISA